MTKFEYSELAAQDVAEQLSYLLQHSQTAAVELEQALTKLLAALAAREFEGPDATLRSGQVIHSWPLYPLRVYYQRRGATLYVVRVHHGSKRPIERKPPRRHPRPRK